MNETPGISETPKGLAKMLGWSVVGLSLMALAVLLVFWAAEAMGGPATFFSCGGCVLAGRFFWTAAGKEQGVARAFGYGLAGLLCVCALAISGVVGYVVPLVFPG